MPTTAARVARHLGLSPATFERYRKAEQAPRAVMLALFWESRWGRAYSDVDASNAASAQFQRAAGLERENAALRRQIASLEAMIAQGTGHAANAPFYVIGAA